MTRALLLAFLAAAAPVDIKPVLATETLRADPDDPAVWVNRRDPGGSLIVGTIKAAAPLGGLVVAGLDGKTRQLVDGIDRPNNVDIEYGLPLAGGMADIAVTTERLKTRLRVFRIRPDASGLDDVSSATGLTVFAGEQGEFAAPMGIGLYKRPRDGAVFAIVARKTGPKQGYLWQYRLRDDGKGKVAAEKVRELGAFSGVSEIEAVAVDDALGYVYYADEGAGIRKYHADPDHPEAANELALFGTSGFRGDREGIGIYTRRDGTGYVVCTDQLPGNSEYHLFRREGRGKAAPHDHSETVRILRGGADSTDGLEVVSAPLGPRFPRGLMVAMNSGPRNFLVYDWRALGLR